MGIYGKYMAAHEPSHEPNFPYPNYNVTAGSTFLWKGAKFEVKHNSRNQYWFKTAFGLYLIGRTDGTLRGNGTQYELRRWAKFTPECIEGRLTGQVGGNEFSNGEVEFGGAYGSGSENGASGMGGGYGSGSGNSAYGRESGYVSGFDGANGIGGGVHGMQGSHGMGGEFGSGNGGHGNRGGYGSVSASGAYGYEGGYGSGLEGGNGKVGGYRSGSGSGANGMEGGYGSGNGGPMGGGFGAG